MSSIRGRLLKWLVGPILLMNFAVAGLTYLLAWTPAQLAFDQGLLDAAAALAARVQAAPAGASAAAGPADAPVFAVRGAGGRLLAGDPAFPPMPAGGTAQPYDAAIRGEPVRVAALAVQARGDTLQVGVARPLRQRHEVRAAILRSLFMLEALLTLVVVGVVWLSVSKGLQPLSRMRANLAAREGDELAPVSGDGVPFELAPVVTAFNGLLEKVEAGAKAQRDFLADMAHQLRTPLAGLKLQLEWLDRRHAGDPETVHSVALMRLANERMIRQTNQLLALARATQGGVGKARFERLDLAGLVQETIQYFVDEAGKKDIDIGFELAPAIVHGDAFLLRDLVDNLVDNAVRYTPAGGRVTVRCLALAGSALFEVEDSGPGIPAGRRGQVFERFVRLDDKTAGSGLGLAIVRDIAQAHRAKIVLDGMPDGPGMRFTVRFPAPQFAPDV